MPKDDGPARCSFRETGQDAGLNLPGWLRKLGGRVFCILNYLKAQVGRAEPGLNR